MRGLGQAGAASVLEFLDVSFCQGLGPELFTVLAPLPSLRVLEAGHCYGLRGGAQECLALRSMERLAELRLDYCHGFVWESAPELGVLPPALESLSLLNSHPSVSTALAGSCWSSLRSLAGVDQDSAWIGALCLRPPPLKKLTLRHYTGAGTQWNLLMRLPQIQELSLLFPMWSGIQTHDLPVEWLRELRVLNLSGWGALAEGLLRRLATCCPRLRRIVVANAFAAVPEGWLELLGAHELQEVRGLNWRRLPAQVREKLNLHLARNRAFGTGVHARLLA
eukprot:gb/GEZN01013843.1/.p1 GENE.gb/GEZN01013843.1/~~gb/GEZN01013843.1/.p1  ORF type:complete len:279 (+),score=38.65 gb/GEZN01013843.1/:100-936(+)